MDQIKSSLGQDHWSHKSREIRTRKILFEEPLHSKSQKYYYYYDDYNDEVIKSLNKYI